MLNIIMLIIYNIYYSIYNNKYIFSDNTCIEVIFHTLLSEFHNIFKHKNRHGHFQYRII